MRKSVSATHWFSRLYRFLIQAPHHSEGLPSFALMNQSAPLQCLHGAGIRDGSSMGRFTTTDPKVISKKRMVDS